MAGYFCRARHKQIPGVADHHHNFFLLTLYIFLFPLCKSLLYSYIPQAPNFFRPARNRLSFLLLTCQHALILCQKCGLWCCVYLYIQAVRQLRIFGCKPPLRSCLSFASAQYAAKGGVHLCLMCIAHLPSHSHCCSAHALITIQHFGSSCAEIVDQSCCDSAVLLFARLDYSALSVLMLSAWL